MTVILSPMMTATIKTLAICLMAPRAAAILILTTEWVASEAAKPIAAALVGQVSTSNG
jgi:hypothetical protein